MTIGNVHLRAACEVPQTSDRHRCHVTDVGHRTVLTGAAACASAEVRPAGDMPGAWVAGRLIDAEAGPAGDDRPVAGGEGRDQATGARPSGREHVGRACQARPSSQVRIASAVASAWVVSIE
ncbi:hypothetical protein Q0Z83_042450 [Actinoplanes sichuanensis]|nr:hypothetical protein Q0Z83_042450 [Actinoplanes sichuanensis]